MKYIQFAMVVIIVANAVMVLPKRYDEKNEPDCFYLEIASLAGLFCGRTFQTGIISLVLLYISISGISRVWYADLISAGVSKRGSVLLVAVFFVFEIMVWF